jgi:hypothetical protein
MSLSLKRRSTPCARLTGVLALAASLLVGNGIGQAWAATQPVACNKISLGQCLHLVEQAYDVTIALNPAIGAKEVQVTTASPDPVRAVKDIFEATDGMVPAIEQDAAKKLLSITVIDASGQMFSPTVIGAQAVAKAAAYGLDKPKTEGAPTAANAAGAAGGPDAGDVNASDGKAFPPSFTPAALPPEDPDAVVFPASGDDPPLTLRELKEKAADINFDDPDRVVEMPDNSDFPKMTVRQLTAIRERAALQMDDPNATVGPQQPEGENLTLKQVLEIRKRDAEALKNQKEVVMPDGTVFPVTPQNKPAPGKQ